MTGYISAERDGYFRGVKSMIGLRHVLGPILLAAGMASADLANAQHLRVELNPSMLTNEAGVGDPRGLVDEQREIVGPPAGKPNSTWQLNSKLWKQFPVSAYLDLGTPKNLSSLWIYDTNGKGEVEIRAGEPGKWTKVATYDCAAYLSWAEVPLDVTTRYLRITRMSPVIVGQSCR